MRNLIPKTDRATGKLKKAIKTRATRYGIKVGTTRKDKVGYGIPLNFGFKNTKGVHFVERAKAATQTQVVSIAKRELEKELKEYFRNV